MAEYYDDLGRLAGDKLRGENAPGGGINWGQLAAGGALAYGGLSQQKKAKEAQAGLGQSNIETMSLVGRMQLDELLKMLGGQAGQTQQAFSKGAAQQDAMGMVQQIFDQYQKTALPQIYNAQTGAGAYGTTGGQLLANDAYAQTVNKAASTVNQNVLNYAQAYQQQMSPLVQLLGIDKGGTKVGTDTTGFGQVGAQAMQAGASGQSKTQAGLSTIGGAIGASFFGPVGGILGSAAGSIIGGWF